MPVSTTNPKALRPFWPPQATGNYYSTSIATATLTTLTVTSGLMYAIPILIPQTVTVTSIGIEVTTFASGNVQLGMYNDGGGYPGSLKFDAGNTATGTSNNFKSIGSLSQALVPGIYWIAGIFSATPGVRALTTSSSLHWLGASSGTDTTIHTAITVSQAYGALPNPFTGGYALSTANPPRLMIGV